MDNFDNSDYHNPNCNVPLCSFSNHKRDKPATPIPEPIADARRRQIVKTIRSNVRPCLFNKYFNARGFKIQKCFLCNIKFGASMPFFWLTHIFGTKHFNNLYHSGFYYTDEGLEFYETIVNESYDPEPESCNCGACNRSVFVGPTRPSISRSDEFCSDRSISNENSGGHDLHGTDYNYINNMIYQNASGNVPDSYSERDIEDVKTYHEAKLRERDARNEILLKELKERNKVIEGMNATLEEKNKSIADLMIKHQKEVMDRETLMKNKLQEMVSTHKMALKGGECEKCVVWKENYSQLEVRFAALKQLAVKYRNRVQGKSDCKETLNRSIETNTDPVEHLRECERCDSNNLANLQINFIKLQELNSKLTDEAHASAKVANGYLEDLENLKMEVNAHHEADGHANSVDSNACMMSPTYNDQAEEQINILHSEVEKSKERGVFNESKGHKAMCEISDELEPLKIKLVSLNGEIIELNEEKNQLAEDLREMSQKYQEVTEQLNNIQSSIDDVTYKNKEYRTRLDQIKHIADYV